MSNEVGRVAHVSNLHVVFSVARATTLSLMGLDAPHFKRLEGKKTAQAGMLCHSVFSQLLCGGERWTMSITEDAGLTPGASLNSEQAPLMSAHRPDQEDSSAPHGPESSWLCGRSFAWSAR